jgi:hypothetical protein
MLWVKKLRTIAVPLSALRTIWKDAILLAGKLVNRMESFDLLHITKALLLEFWEITLGKLHSMSRRLKEYLIA